MEYFEETWKDHWRQTWPLLLYVAGLFLAPLASIKKYGADNLTRAIVLSIVFFGPFIVAHSIIHWRFIRVSRGLIIGFDEVNAELVIVRNGVERRIQQSEIAEVQINVSFASTHSSGVRRPWQRYGYAVIRLETEEKFLVTVLHVPDLEWFNQFKNVTTRTTDYLWPPDPDSW